MRILHTTNHCLFGNGNVHAAVDLACEQARLGHTVAYVSSGGYFVDLLEANGVKHYTVKLDQKKPIAMLKAIFGLLKVIKDFSPQIFHAHMMNGALLGYVVTRVKGLKLVTTVHNSFDGHAILMGLGDRIICVSKAVADTMAKKGASKKKLRAVLNGTLGAARRNTLSRVPTPLNRPSLTTVCGMHHRKGVNDLIAAFDTVSQQNSAVNLYLIGEGPHEAEYRAQAARLTHADRVHFMGLLRDPNPYLLSTDIFVLASLQDPCPLVIPEAREAGCAIVATNVDGIPEMLSIGPAGLMFPPKDVPAMTQAIMSLLNDETALAKSKQASLTDIGYFNIERVCLETLDIYKGILKKGVA
jgi:glycosyltransferase involved in cell wall biosynthesis